jgi:hypothetical protein
MLWQKWQRDGLVDLWINIKRKNLAGSTYKLFLSDSNVQDSHKQWPKIFLTL